jgi:ribosomal protein S18 acetylase RimI-like enzyme
MNQKQTPPPAVRLRLAAPADGPRLIALTNAAFAVESFFDGTRIDSERLAALMAKGRILIAVDRGGKLVASVYMELRGTRGYLGMLAVDPALQGRGLGRKMVGVAENRFRRLRLTAVDITVLSLRPELPPIYRKLGYVETGTEEFRPSVPLKPGLKCHCIVMSKPL